MALSPFSPASSNDSPSSRASARDATKAYLALASLSQLSPMALRPREVGASPALALRALDELPIGVPFVLEEHMELCLVRETEHLAVLDGRFRLAVARTHAPAASGAGPPTGAPLSPVSARAPVSSASPFDAPSEECLTPFGTPPQISATEQALPSAQRSPLAHAAVASPEEARLRLAPREAAGASAAAPAEATRTERADSGGDDADINAGGSLRGSDASLDFCSAEVSPVAAAADRSGWGAPAAGAPAAGAADAPASAFEDAQAGYPSHAPLHASAPAAAPAAEAAPALAAAPAAENGGGGERSGLAATLRARAELFEARALAEAEAAAASDRPPPREALDGGKAFVARSEQIRHKGQVVEDALARAATTKLDLEGEVARIAADEVSGPRYVANGHTELAKLPSADRCRLLCAFRNNTTIQTLELSNAGLDNAAAKALAEILSPGQDEGAAARPHNATLTSLNVENNSIGSEGLCALADMLPLNSTLRELKLAYQNVTVGRVAEERVAAQLEHNTALLKLTLETRQVRSRERCDKWLMRNAQLRRLRLQAGPAAPTVRAPAPPASASQPPAAEPVPAAAPPSAAATAAWARAEPMDALQSSCADAGGPAVIREAAR